MEEVEKLKEKIKIAHEAVQDEPDPYKLEAFKIVLGKLLKEHMVNSASKTFQQDTTPTETTPSGNLSVRKLDLATRCKITPDQLKNVLLITENKVEIVKPIESNSDSKKMIIAAQCIIITHEVVFEQEWIKASVMTDCFREIGIKDPGHNLAALMTKNSDLFLKRPNAQEYRLTTDKGRLSAFETIRKLAIGEE